MGRDAQRIHAGPADITLHDSTNGYLYLGYVDDVRLRGKNRSHDLIDGNLRQYGSQYELKATLLQSDYETYEAIETRRGTRQTIYLVGANSMTTMANMFVNVVPDYPYSHDKPHVLELQARTRVENDVNKYVNLLGTDGQFETDTNSDGIADGWQENNLGSKSIVASWRTGNAQRCVTSGANGVFYTTSTGIICPFEGPAKITFSVYARSSGTAGNVQLQIELRTAAASIVTSSGSVEVLADGVERRLTHSGLLVPTTQVLYVRVYMYMATTGQTIDFDDAQVEFSRDVTTWTEN